MKRFDPVTQARIDLTAALRSAARMGLNEGVCNHFSLEMPGDPRKFLINPQGLHWSEITPADLMIVDGKGAVVEGKHTVEPTAFFIHGRIHLGKRKKCVLHTHMPFATALTLLRPHRLRPRVRRRRTGQRRGRSHLQRAWRQRSGLHAASRRDRLRRQRRLCLRRPVLSRALLHGAGAGARQRWKTQARAGENGRRSGAADRRRTPAVRPALRSAEAPARSRRAGLVTADLIDPPPGNTR